MPTALEIVITFASYESTGLFRTVALERTDWIWCMDIVRDLDFVGVSLLVRLSRLLLVSYIMLYIAAFLSFPKHCSPLRPSLQQAVR